MMSSRRKERHEHLYTVRSPFRVSSGEGFENIFIGNLLTVRADRWKADSFPARTTGRFQTDDSMRWLAASIRYSSGFFRISSALIFMPISSLYEKKSPFSVPVSVQKTRIPFWYFFYCAESAALFSPFFFLRYSRSIHFLPEVFQTDPTSAFFISSS